MDSDSVGLGWGLTFCLSVKLPGDAHGAENWTALPRMVLEGAFLWLSC